MGLSLTLICYCHLVGMAKIVRGSTFRRTTMKHRYLTIWLTYCISIAFYTVLVKKHIRLSNPYMSVLYIRTRVRTCVSLTMLDSQPIHELRLYLTRNELLLPFWHI